MYRNSFRELQVDYIDYMLLHAVGMGGGMEEFENRYIKNGILDFLVEERKAAKRIDDVSGVHLRSPSRIASNVVRFRLLWRMGDRAMNNRKRLA